VVLGPGGEPIERLSADAAGRHVDHAQQGLVVTGIAEQPQPGHRVPDLTAFEELQATNELVGHAAGAERELEGAGERVGAEQDREVVG